MTFTRARSDIAAWAIGTTPRQAEFNKFDENMAWSIDGHGGGAYSPSSAITIGGTHGLVVPAGTPFSTRGNIILGTSSYDSLTIESAIEANAAAVFHEDVTFSASAPVTFEGAVVCDSTLRTNDALNAYSNVHTHLGFHTHQNATIGDDSSDLLTCNATATFNAPAEFAVAATFSAAMSCTSINASGSLQVAHNATVSGDLGVTGATTLTGAVYTEGDATLGNNSSDTLVCNANAHLNAQVVCNGPVSMGSTGTLSLNQTTLAVNNNGSFSSSGAQTIRITAVGSAGLHLTSAASPRGGVLKIFKNEDPVNAIEIRNSDGSPLISLTAGYAVLMFADGTNWHTLMTNPIGGY